MSDITIDELPVPASLDDPAFAHFARFIDVSNANREHIFGTSLRNLVAPEMVAQLHDQTYFQQRLFVARIDDQIVANTMVGNMGQERSHLAWLGVTVHPDHRRQGIGTTLADHVEAVARDTGSTTFQASVFHTSRPGGPRLASPTGHGDLPAGDPGVRFLQRRGYHLEQIGWLSVLDLPVDPTVLTEQWSLATAAAGADYRVVTWEGPTPDERLDDIALLNFRMFTDAPPANMEYDTTPGTRPASAPKTPPRHAPAASSSPPPLNTGQPAAWSRSASFASRKTGPGRSPRRRRSCSRSTGATASGCSSRSPTSRSWPASARNRR